VAAVSVILPTRGRHLTLPAVLTPLIDDAGVDEVLVVVDGDDPPTAKLLDAMRDAEPRIRRLRGPGRGPAAARQVGLEAARGDIVLLMDDDMVADAGLASAHADRHAAADDLVVCGSAPVALTAESSLATRLYADAYARWEARARENPDALLLHLLGANVSLRRETCLRIGFDAPGMTGVRSHEDREFGIRCLENGLRGVFGPELSATHRHERDLASFRHDCLELGRGRARIHQLHPETLGPLPANAYADGLPPGAGLLVRAGRTRAGHAVIGRALEAAIGDGTGRRALPLGRLLRRVDQARGAALG
jgi:glycosyltransferase involved in cell wall biosynthesis